MKANEAPEKIYLFENPVSGTPDDGWLFKRSDENDIEYTQTNAFIEKACDWLATHINDYLVKGRDIDYMFDDFRKAMKD